MAWRSKRSLSLTFTALFISLASLSYVAVEGQQKSAKNKLESRVSQLLEWSTRRSIITLSSEKFNNYVKSKPRNYSIIATFTALKPQRQCSICSEAYDEFTIVANSWRYSQQYSSQVFFVKVDIDEDGMDAFQQMHLTTAPTYFHFPPTGKRKPEDKYDIARNGYSAEPLTKWIAERTGVHISIMRPPNYTLLMIWIPVILLASVIGYLKRENLYMLYDTKYWAAAAMIWIFVMISGQMWNQIRGPPFAHRNPQTGEMGYFSGTSQYQFIAETYFVIVLYAIMAVGMLLLNERFSVFEDLGMQKITPVIGLALVVLDFGYILSIFRMKYQGYPYRSRTMHLKDVAQNFNVCNFFIYCCLLVVSVLLSLQVDGVIRWSYGIIFIPLWIWKTLTFIATTVGIIVFAVKKKLRKEKDNTRHLIVMIQSCILHFIIFIQEILIAINLDREDKLVWRALFVPLYVLSAVSIVTCVFSCCLKKCHVEKPIGAAVLLFEWKQLSTLRRTDKLEVLGFINLLQIIFLGVKLDEVVMWRWAVVLIPTWIVLCLTCILIVLYMCIQCCLINAEANQQVTELKVPLVTTTIIAFSLSFVSFTVFLGLVVSQLDGNLSAPYTATFVPLHISILCLLPTTFTRQPANPLWFGLQKSFVDVLIEVCPVFKEYFNVSWSKKADEAEMLSEIHAKLKSKCAKQQLAKTTPVSVTMESKHYSYEDIMTPD